MLFSMSMLSQDNILKGKIKAKSVEYFGVNIYNLNQQKGAINDANGNFEISAKINDTIVFTSIQYKELRIVVQEFHLSNNQIEINLEDELHQLSEVLVSKSGLTGNLLTDLDKIPINKNYGNEFFGLPVQNIKPLTLPERNLKTLKTGAVNTILNSLNGKIKKMKSVVEEEKEISLTDKAYRMFTRGMLSKELGLPDEEVKRFLFYCVDDVDVSKMKSLVNDNRVFELLGFFKEKVAQYKKGKEE